MLFGFSARWTWLRELHSLNSSCLRGGHTCLVFGFHGLHSSSGCHFPIYGCFQGVHLWHLSAPPGSVPIGSTQPKLFGRQIHRHSHKLLSALGAQHAWHEREDYSNTLRVEEEDDDDDDSEGDLYRIIIILDTWTGLE